MIVENAECEYPDFILSFLGNLYDCIFKDVYSDPKVVAVFLNVGKPLIYVPFKFHIKNTQNVDTFVNTKNRHLHNFCKCLLDYGAPTGNRTPNLLIKSQLLCQLSYRRVFLCAIGNVKKPLRNVKSCEYKFRCVHRFFAGDRFLR